MTTSNQTPQQNQQPTPGLFARLRQFIVATSGSPKESGTPRNGFMSYPAEWHAVALGFGVGYAGTPGQQTAVLAYALGRGGAKKQFGDDAHIKDMADEPAYSVAAMAAGRAARRAEIVTAALPI